MHENLSSAVSSIIDRITFYGLSVSDDQKLALRYMESSVFTNVKKNIEKQTKIKIKTTFTQSLIDYLLVLDPKKLELVKKITIEDSAIKTEKNSRVKKEDISPNHKNDSPSRLYSSQPYRRDNRDISKPKIMIKDSNIVETTTRSDSDTFNTPLVELDAPTYTLTDIQIEQLVTRGSLKSIRGILRNNMLMLSTSQRNELRNRIFKLSYQHKYNTITTRNTTIQVRTNQAAFRAKVLSEYNEKCAITDITIVAILEAAHVIPVNGNNDCVDNSLLLSKNMHGLFDRFLISINPESNTLELSKSIMGKGLDSYIGKVIKHKVSYKNLNWHYEQFKNGLNTEDISEHLI
ncbi:HNH endonuclease [Photobacterium kishitanii]|uniref:HNH endonuclease n=1 Tax=Photobacterium kishitanii TaxID=318456 RepID=UPI000D1706F5|nr:HNH endonuclease signature motif containing protein [Photobacterium kishitanii]PSU20609.1 hypothetical protein CTM84_12370 [Photobacterium kishitanii]